MMVDIFNLESSFLSERLKYLLEYKHYIFWLLKEGKYFCFELRGILAQVLRLILLAVFFDFMDNSETQ